MTIAELQQWGRLELRQSESAVLDTDLLLRHVLSGESNSSDSVLYGDRSRQISSDLVERFRGLVARRKSHEPIAYLIGTREFYSLDFEVSPAVLIPRPETELLVDRLLIELSAAQVETLPRYQVVDIGTGSGAIIISAMNEIKKRYGTDVIRRGDWIATDISEDALQMARRNGNRLGVADKLQFHHCDLFPTEVLQGIDRSTANSPWFIVSNPPYVSNGDKLPPDVERFEPVGALRAGPEGLDVIARLLETTQIRFPQGTRLLVEIGDNQTGRLESVLRRLGTERYSFHKDLRGVNRVVQVET